MREGGRSCGRVRPLHNLCNFIQPNHPDWVWRSTMPELAGSLHNSSADRDALTAGSPAPPDKGMPRHRGLTWHGYLVQLLHIASSIEHALMIQYLYAAYS